MNKDKGVILEFLDEIQTDFDLIIQNINLLSSKQKGVIVILIDSREKVIPQFAKIKEQIDDINFDTAANIDLSHHQLISKYKAYKTARGRFRNAMQNFDSLKENEITKSTELARNLFKSMDTFLGGLSRNIPHVYAIKGFKKIIEDIIS